MPLRALMIALLMLAAAPSAVAEQSDKGAHAFSFTSIDGEALPLSDFRGKTLLLVNTASRCGFTHQYADLQALWQRYRDDGLVVLGVPSNDFGGQEPGSEAEIKEFCEVNFSVDFPLTEKATVNGMDAHPLYRWAVDVLGKRAAPRWNFHKYLIGPEGELIAWFPTSVSPTSETVTQAVEAALGLKAAQPG